MENNEALELLCNSYADNAKFTIPQLLAVLHRFKIHGNVTYFGFHIEVMIANQEYLKVSKYLKSVQEAIYGVN